MQYILIFKTNIEFEFDICQIKNIFNNISSITNWSIDREDIDKVLRIESLNNNVAEIINSLNNLGYLCEELQD
jgi:hypothetical protein